jgi:hypothetical protein
MKILLKLQIIVLKRSNFLDLAGWNYPVLCWNRIDTAQFLRAISVTFFAEPKVQIFNYDLSVFEL